MNEWNETEIEGAAEWTHFFCAEEECNLLGLAFFADFNMSCGLHRQPPTPTGAASGLAGWIRLTAPPTANEGRNATATPCCQAKAARGLRQGE